MNGALRVDDFRREYPELGDVPGVETLGGVLLKCLDVASRRRGRGRRFAD